MALEVSTFTELCKLISPDHETEISLEQKQTFCRYYLAPHLGNYSSYSFTTEKCISLIILLYILESHEEQLLRARYFQTLQNYIDFACNQKQNTESDHKKRKDKSNL